MENDLKIVIAQNIRKYRELKGLTQEKLAELSGKSLSFIGDVENKRTAPSLKTVQIIADILCVEPYELLMPSEKNKENYNEAFVQSLRGKIDPELFKLLEKFLLRNEHE